MPRSRHTRSEHRLRLQAVEIGRAAGKAGNATCEAPHGGQEGQRDEASMAAATSHHRRRHRGARLSSSPRCHTLRAGALDRIHRLRIDPRAQGRPGCPQHGLAIGRAFRRPGQRHAPQSRRRPVEDRPHTRLLAPSPQGQARRPLHHALRRRGMVAAPAAHDPQHRRRRTRPDPQPRRQAPLFPLEPARRARRIRHLLQPPQRPPLAQAPEPRQEGQQRVRRMRPGPLAHGGRTIFLFEPSEEEAAGRRAQDGLAQDDGRTHGRRLRYLRRQERDRARGQQPAPRHHVPKSHDHAARRQPGDGEGRQRRAPVAREVARSRRPLGEREARRSRRP